MAGQIVIEDMAAFQAKLGALTKLHDGLDAKIKAVTAVIDAATAAAKDGVQYGEPGPGGTTVAPVYAETLTSLNAALGVVVSSAEKGRDAVGLAIRDLSALLAGMSRIDQSGADAVNRA